MKTVGKLILLTFKLEISGIVSSFFGVRSVCLLWVNTRFMLCSSSWLVMVKFPELQEKQLTFVPIFYSGHSLQHGRCCHVRAGASGTQRAGGGDHPPGR